MLELRQSTASQEVLIGPMVDSTDGVTAETGLTIANTDIKLHVAGATTLANKNSGGATHISAGNYYAVMDATDTATLGSGRMIVQVSGAAPWFRDFNVITAAEYDRKYSTGVQAVNVTQWNGAAVATPATAGYPAVTVKVGTGTGEINLSGGNVPIRTGLKQGVGFTLPFTMRDTSNAPLTGSTVTVYRCIAPATAFTLVGTATEIASGFYSVALANGDVNGASIAIRMIGSGGSGVPADNGMTLIMEP